MDTFNLRTPVQVRFTDIDMLGHLNNNVYLQFMDLAKVEYFTKCNGGKLELGDINLVVANINVNFFAMTLLGEELEVLTRVESVGNKSLVLHQKVVEQHTGEVKCEGHTVMVCVELSTGQAIPVESRWRTCFAKFEGREF